MDNWKEELKELTFGIDFIGDITPDDLESFIEKTIIEAKMEVYYKLIHHSPQLTKHELCDLRDRLKEQLKKQA